MATSASRRRLARDHAELRSSPPPDFFFPTSLTLSTYSLSTVDSDLTTLTIHLLGPVETPYSSGLFTLHLTIPPTYPTAPPTATFRTKIFHPNVDERSGDVCVDTLKRDWTTETTLKDVLLTIRCLLIFPNPESSLNESAGKMLREDYRSFERHAKLMTEVHAMVPRTLRSLVEEVRARGETTDGEEEKEKGKAETKNKKTVKPEEESASEAGKENTLTLHTTPSITALNTTIATAATANSPLHAAPIITVSTASRPPTPSNTTAGKTVIGSSLGKRPIMSESHDNLPASESRKQVKLSDALVNKLADTVISSPSSLPGTLKIGEKDGNVLVEGRKGKETLKRLVVKRAVSAAEKKSAAVKKSLKRF